MPATACTCGPPAAPTGPGIAARGPVGAGRIRAGGIERDITFGEAAADAHAEIDAAYHTKYDRYGATTVGHVTGPDAQPVTIRSYPRTAPMAISETARKTHAELFPHHVSSITHSEGTHTDSVSRSRRLAPRLVDR